MGFNVDFYKYAKEPNILYKDLLNRRSMNNVNFKDDVNIVDPVLLLNVNDINIFVEYNYCYIENLKRYYFIVNYNIVKNNLIEIYLHIDVLMTYKEYLIDFDTLLYCTRDTVGDYKIPDKMAPMTNKKSTESYNYAISGLYSNGLLGPNINNTRSEPFYVIILSTDPSSVNVGDVKLVQQPNISITTYPIFFANRVDCWKFLRDMMRVSFANNDNNFINTLEFVQGVYICPLNLSAFGSLTYITEFSVGEGGRFVPLSIGGQDIRLGVNTENVFTISPNQKFTFTTAEEINWYDINKEWYRQPPHATHYVKLPYSNQLYEFPISLFSGYDIGVVFRLDVLTGEMAVNFLNGPSNKNRAYLYNYGESESVFTITYNIYTPLTYNSTDFSTINMNKTVNNLRYSGSVLSSIIGGGVGFAASVASGNFVGAGLSIANTTANIVNEMFEKQANDVSISKPNLIQGGSIGSPLIYGGETSNQLRFFCEYNDLAIYPNNTRYSENVGVATSKIITGKDFYDNRRTNYTYFKGSIIKLDPYYYETDPNFKTMTLTEYNELNNMLNSGIKWGLVEV